MIILSINTVYASDDVDMFMNHGSVMLIIDPNSGEIVFANQSASDFYLYSVEELLEMNINELNILTSEEIKTEMEMARIEARNYFEFIHQLADNSLRYVEVYSYPINYQGQMMLFSIIIDVTDKKEAEAAVVALNEAREQSLKNSLYVSILIVLIFIFLLAYTLKSNKQLKYVTNYDALTQVLNRKSGRDRFEKINEKGNLPLAFFMIDLNNLKFINDTYGHISGDMVIKDVAYTLDNYVYNQGYVSRVSGDEFVLILPQISCEEAELIKSLIKRTTFESNDISFNVSIGYIHANEIKEYDMLFSMAESDMYADKSIYKSKNNKRILDEMSEKLKDTYPQMLSKYLEKVILYIGNELKILPEELDAILLAGRYKDIGILAKDELLEHSKCSPEKSFLILKSLDIPFNVANTVLHNKEKYDGSGYPQGIKGDDIPFSARILSIAQSICELIETKQTDDPIQYLSNQNNQYDNKILSTLNSRKTLLYIRELIGE